MRPWLRTISKGQETTALDEDTDAPRGPLYLRQRCSGSGMHPNAHWDNGKDPVKN
jgi:hypothetical protein